MANTVCPHCGSKNTEALENYEKCLDCGMSFGREEVADNGESLIKAVHGLRFRYGDVVSGSVRLRMAEDSGVCVFEVYDANNGGVDKVADVISMDEWKHFSTSYIWQTGIKLTFLSMTVRLSVITMSGNLDWMSVMMRNLSIVDTMLSLHTGRDS